MTEDEIKAANENPLCDRLDEIHKLACRALRLKDSPSEVEFALQEIEALSIGFMKIPGSATGESNG